MPTDEPVFLAFPSGMLVHQKQLDKGVASDPVMESMVQSLANELFTQVVRPQPDADLLRYGLFAYATEAIHENYKGDAIRRETILQLLHQYDDARAQAVEKPPLRWALSDSAPQEFMVYGKVSLFLFALEDQYGRENVRRGIKFMVQSLRGGQYDYNDFRAALESTTGKDLAGFFRTWLDEKGIPADFRERYEAPMEKK